MRAYRTWAAFLGAALCSAVPTGAQAPQYPNKPQRDYGGWEAAPRAAASRPGGLSNGVKQANFQAPGGNFDPGSLPALPSGFGGASLPQQMDAAPSLGSAPNLPSTSMPAEGVMQAGGAVQPAYDQFANPGGQLQATDVRQASGSALRDVSQANVPVLPPQSYSQPGFGQPAYASQQGGQSAQSHLRSIPANVAQQRQMHNGTEFNIPVVTQQDPRFVSPPPAPRVGNFATSPYQSNPYRLASYQVNQQVPAQSVQVPVGQAGQPAVVPNTSRLPQYQPTVGVYPTSYQQCGPNIPAAGVPQVVPGAVAPPTLPPNLTPQLYTPDNAGYKPLISLGQENYNVLLGRGIVGQPTVYVPGQPFRNFFRYLSP
ncbi:MAG: hypothetical protein ACTHK7_05890 [Aureliella sp.]